MCMNVCVCVGCVSMCVVCMGVCMKASTCVCVVWFSGCVLGSGPEVPEFKPLSGNFPSHLL